MRRTKKNVKSIIIFLIIILALSACTKINDPMLQVKITCSYPQNNLTIPKENDTTTVVFSAPDITNTLDGTKYSVGVKEPGSDGKIEGWFTVPESVFKEGNLKIIPPTIATVREKESEPIRIHGDGTEITSIEISGKDDGCVAVNFSPQNIQDLGYVPYKAYFVIDGVIYDNYVGQYHYDDGYNPDFAGAYTNDMDKFIRAEFVFTDLTADDINDDACIVLISATSEEYVLSNYNMTIENN